MLGAGVLAGGGGSFAIAAQTHGNIRQPLARHIPADALLYVGWRGGPAVRKQYEASRMGAVLGAVDSKALSAVLLRYALRSSRQQQRLMRQGMALLKIAAMHPSAFTVTARLAAGHLQPVALLAIRAGHDAASARRIEHSLAAQFNKSQQPARQPGHAAVYQVGADLVMQISNLDDKKHYFMASGAADTLAGVKAFAGSIGEVQSQASLVAYVNVAAGDHLVEAYQTRHPAQNDRQTWAAIKRWGYLDIRRIAYSAGFDGRDWRSETYVQLHGHRGYVGAIFHRAALPRHVLRDIPETAVNVRAGQLHLNACLASFMKSNAQIAREWPKISHAAKKLLGVSIRKDLIGPLSGGWVMYQALDATGLASDPVFVHPLAHPAAFNKTLQLISGGLNKLLRNHGIPVGLMNMRVGKLRYETAQLPIAMAPTFAVAHKIFYFGLSAEPVVAAARGAFGKKSIRANPVFMALEKRLGVPSGVHAAVTFMKTRLIAGNTMAYVQQVLLPTLQAKRLLSNHIKIHSYNAALRPLSPLLSVAWSGAAGWHERFIGPMPGAQYLGMTPLLDGGIAPTMLAILVPALAKARQYAFRAESSNNQGQIVAACLNYAKSHGNKFPPNLATLLAARMLQPKTLIHPGLGHMPLVIPATERGNVAWIGARLKNHCDYIYGGNGLTTGAGSSVIVVYGKFASNNGAGCNAAFANGRTSWLDPGALKRHFHANNRARRNHGFPLLKLSAADATAAGTPMP